MTAFVRGPEVSNAATAVAETAPLREGNSLRVSSKAHDASNPAALALVLAVDQRAEGVASKAHP
jgi:hypothetical protein